MACGIGFASVVSTIKYMGGGDRFQQWYQNRRRRGVGVAERRGDDE